MEPNIAGADLRDVVRTGLDDEDGHEVFASWAGDEDCDDGTRIPVTLSGGLWRLRKSDGTVVTGQARDTNTRGTAKLRTHDGSTRALGYALITKDRRDVRPDLLRLLWDRDMRTLPKLIGYGRDYLHGSGHDRSSDALEAAAADALLIMVQGHRRGLRARYPTLRIRETQFRLHHGGFGLLRKAALQAFRRRYQEACERFRAVHDWAPTSYGIGRGGFKSDSLWHPERIKRGLLTTSFPHNQRGKEDHTVPRFHAARRAA